MNSIASFNFFGCCFLLIISLTGCSDSDNNNDDSVNNEVPVPELSSPSVGDALLPGPFFDDRGYEKAEYFISGTAESYTNVNELKSSGEWQVQAAEVADYKTRVVVFRPSNPANYNGVVIVEWLNVSAGSDLANDWMLAHTELTRSGYAWIGVSAQARGVESLKGAGPERYSTMNHPGDSFSYSIFSQIGNLIRSNPDEGLLGSLGFDALIAAGESQSAFRLLTYVNALSKQDEMYDGYFIHSRYYSSAPLSQSPQEDISAPEIVLIRDDLKKPVMMLQTESDVVALSSYLNRQPDSDYFRLWEAAGTAHADYYITATNRTDNGDDPNVAAVFENPLFCDKPINTGPQHFLVKAAIASLAAWVVEGTLPTIADRLVVDEAIPALARDDLGIALGGIRTSFVEAPLATLSGEGNSSESFGFCNRLFGTTKLFDANTIASLYADNEAYLNAVTASTNEAVANGFLLPDDASLIIEYAAQLDIFD